MIAVGNRLTEDMRLTNSRCCQGFIFCRFISAIGKSFVRVFILAALASPLFADTFKVLQYKDGRLTIRATQTSLVDVAQKLSELTDITFIVTEGADQLVNIDIVDEPFATAIAKISPNNLLKRKSIDNKEVFTEVVFMLNDSDNSFGLLDGNLPTGEPTQEVLDQADSFQAEPEALDTNTNQAGSDTITQPDSIQTGQ